MNVLFDVLTTLPLVVSKVIDVGEKRDEKSVNCLLSNIFTKEQSQSVNTVSMDMWKAYINSVNTNFPNAEIVHDKFHLIAYLNKGIIR